ncbi:hypothetical protein AAW14_25095 [Streptomyces hygroscopicus]|nr:hypothetical protein [Streptomyces hygroscopicus]
MAILSTVVDRLPEREAEAPVWPLDQAAGLSPCRRSWACRVRFIGTRACEDEASSVRRFHFGDRYPWVASDLCHGQVADRQQRGRVGQHCAGRQCRHVHQAMAHAVRLAGLGNLGQPGQKPRQFVLGGVRLIAELVKDGRDRRRYDGRHGLP